MTDITSTSSPPGAPTGMQGATEPSSAQQAKDAAQHAKDEAANVAGTAMEQAGTVASSAVDEAKHLGSEAADEARRLLIDARDQLRTKAQEQSERVGSTMGDLGQQLRTMADAGQPGLAQDLVSQAAWQVQQMAQRMQHGGLDRLLDDTRRLARNRPGTFLLGAAAAGFVAARVARTADTGALKDAAMPSQGQGPNGHQTGSSYGSGIAWAASEPDLSLEATQPRPTPQSEGTGGAPAGATSANQGPLVADPLAREARTATMPALGDRP